MGFGKLKKEHMGEEASGEIRRQLGAGELFRDPKQGHKLKRKLFSPLHRAPGHKKESGVHEVVFQQMINLPRMRMLEATFIQRERRLRQKMRRKLQSSDSGAYDHWLMERRLRSTEKLRRRRVLLAFNEEQDDPEVAHRQLQRVNRRLHEISVNAHSPSTLQAAGRRLVADDDEHDRKLRYLLDDDDHLLSDNHADYRREFNIKPTSRAMREMMQLTHAAKRNLYVLPTMNTIADYLTEQTTKKGGMNSTAVLEWAQDTLVNIYRADPAMPNVTYDAEDLQASRQEMRVLQTVRDADNLMLTLID